MEKCGELPAAEPEIEPRCPGLVLKLPGLSRRAMSRLQCRGIFLSVKSKALTGRVNPPSSRMGCKTLELRLSAQPCAGAERRQSGLVGACQLCCLCPHAAMCGSDISLRGAGRSAHMCLFHLTACTAQVSSPVV